MRLINIILEHIANKFGYYKLPRYYVYFKLDKKGKWLRVGTVGEPFIFSYYNMLECISQLKSTGSVYECKTEKIESERMFKNKKDGKIDNWFPNITKGL